MDYIRIHDSIIERARCRKYDSSRYQNHHIIPRCEDQNSIDVVPLTTKEHRIIHFLRYKLGFSLGNLKAYYLLKGNSDIEVNLIITSKAGKLGGARTKENKSGIFSDDYDRAAETKRRHDEGIITPYLKDNSELAKELGYLSYLSGKGIYSDTYDRSQAAKDLWESGMMDHLIPKLQDMASVGGKAAYEKGVGIHVAEKRSLYASLGGSVSGKMPHWTNGIENKKSYTCPGDGWYRGRTLNKYKGKIDNE